MCGIVGYVGKRDAVPILMDGIRNLEYRGYDSAGIAVASKKTINVVKSAGRIKNLEEKIAGGNPMHGSIGIIHSRWATHGEATEKNAHPHSDCPGSIWVVHNGIIENYQELKDALQKRGHNFSSDTDTEVLAHLIEEMQKTHRSSFAQSVTEALKQVKGTYGIAVMDKNNPDVLIAARNFSPLLIGIGEGEQFIASDAAALLAHTRSVIYLRDREYALLTPDGYDIFTLDSEPVSSPVHQLDWDVSMAQKDGHPHFMLKEIMQQPESIADSLRGRIVLDEGKAKLGGLEPIARDLRGIRRLLIVACGTASFAGRVGEYMLEEYAHLPVHVEVGSEFRYKKPVFQKGDALLAISQSGETADTLAAINEAKEKGILTLGIVNVVGSSIARATDAGVYQHVGPEIGVASTKAFTSQVAIMALMTMFLGRQREMSLTMGRRIGQELQKLPDHIRTVFESSDSIKALAKKYMVYDNMLFMGRKYNFPIALEGALKLKEISYVHAEGLGAGEMKHGPIALIDERFPSLVIAPRDSVYEKNLSNIEEIKARKGPVIAITTEGNEDMEKIADDVLYIPKTLEMLTPILSVIPLQLFAYHSAVIRGRDVDKPRNLAKSVTVE